MSDAMRARVRAAAGAVMLVLAAAGCPTEETGARGEGLDVAALPSSVQADYAVFAQRCSKCHSLARPLQSGIKSDDYWRDYVARMRRQPASGISEQDADVILRFLHYYSAEEKAKEKP